MGIMNTLAAELGILGEIISFVGFCYVGVLFLGGLYLILRYHRNDDNSKHK